MKCERCGAETGVTIMSMFNTQTICLDCKDGEARHPSYLQARAAEEAAVRAGNSNFPGAGFQPGDRVEWRGRPGTVNYRRYHPADFTTVDAYSVLLDDQADRPNYSGTIVPAAEVGPCV